MPSNSATLSAKTFVDTDVLIVGAGPTGLMLANQLSRRKVSCMVVERHSGPAEQTRAMAVHARTLEIYAKLGIADKAVELGQIGNGANLWAGGTRKARIPFGDIGKGISPFPYVLMLGQDDNERILGANLQRFGTTIHWNTTLVQLEQDDQHVEATLRLPDGSLQKVVASYVAGCDGGRSSVRDLTGIRFSGAAYEQVFFVADTETTGPMVPGELNVYLWESGFYLFFPMRGADRWRIIGILPEQLKGKEGTDFNDVAPVIQGEAGVKLSFKSCNWFSTYPIHHRCAEHFRNNRCFLLGDAAHVHSPMGGQGMNTGLQDAYNLAWKLSLVVSGQADESLLDSYESERLPLARQLLNSTDRLFQFVVADNWIARMFRRRIMARLAALAMTRESIRKRAFRTLSQTGLHYRHGPLSTSLVSRNGTEPQAGDRFPWLKLTIAENGSIEDMYRRLSDTEFNLIVFGQDLPSPWTLADLGILHTHVIPDNDHNARILSAVNIKGPAFYLLRPDGYIGLVGTRIQPALVVEYFTGIGIAIRKGQV